MAGSKQQYIDMAIEHCIKLGPGYPVFLNHGTIEWHTTHGLWRDTFNFGNRQVVREALYKLCEANGWTVNHADTQSCDPRDDTRIPYDEAVQWVNAVRKQPPHPLAALYKERYLTLS